MGDRDSELLNGSFAQPMWGGVDVAAATAPSEVRSTGTVATGGAIVWAWLILFGLLVVSSVITLNVQR